MRYPGRKGVLKTLVVLLCHGFPGLALAFEVEGSISCGRGRAGRPPPSRIATRTRVQPETLASGVTDHPRFPLEVCDGDGIALEETFVRLDLDHRYALWRTTESYGRFHPGAFSPSVGSCDEARQASYRTPARSETVLEPSYRASRGQTVG